VEFMHQSTVLFEFGYFVVRVRCCRKGSSRSLSHLLMSFLFYHTHESRLNGSGYRNTFEAFDQSMFLVC